MKYQNADDTQKIQELTKMNVQVPHMHWKKKQRYFQEILKF